MRSTVLPFVTGLIMLIATIQCGKSDSVTADIDSDLTKPQLLSPEDSSEQPTSVSLRWREVNEASSYHILLSETDDFSSTLSDSISDSTQFMIEGLPSDTIIHWKVRSMDQNQHGPWSDAHVFVTKRRSDNPKPLSTTLISPADSAKVQTTDITLSWTAVANASGYSVQLATARDFNAPAVDSKVNSTSYQAAALSGDTTYYWRIEPLVENRETQWSEVSSFSTGAADTTGPDVSISDTPQAPSKGDTVTVSASASDSSGISDIKLYIDGDNVEICRDSNSCSHSNNSYDVGSHSYYAIAVDASPSANQSRSNIENFNITENSSSDDTVRIMPLGNSITEAFGYRVPLWEKLTGEGYSVDYVGSQSDPHPDLPDTDHEGHGGWYIGNISEEINGWLATYRPDYVLLMIGTNDIAWWTTRSGAEIAEAHAQLADQIIANSSPDTWLLVASIPPQSSEVIEPNKVDRAQLTRDFNREMEKRMQQRVNNGRQIVFVDIYPRLTVDDLSDGIHPNKQGYEIIAQAWFEALLAILP